MVPDDTPGSASTETRGCPKCGHTETDVGSISTTGGGLLLYWVIRAETDQRPVVDREIAERMVHRDTRDEDEQP